MGGGVGGGGQCVDTSGDDVSTGFSIPCPYMRQDLCRMADASASACVPQPSVCLPHVRAGLSCVADKDVRGGDGGVAGHECADSRWVIAGAG